MRALGALAVLLVIGWVVAHLLYLGPIRDAAEVALAWVLWLAAASTLLAAAVMLVVGMVAGHSSPAWLRFARWARTAATVIGSALVVVGLLHYRETEPRGDVSWVVLGLAVLAGAGIVHWWVVRTQRRVY
jgi:hypothetical protein